MKRDVKNIQVEQITIADDGVFPNSPLPVLIYRKALRLPRILAVPYIRRIFNRNGWGNSWNYGIYDYHHYHSITHEVLGVHKGSAQLLLGGDNGEKVTVRCGDVIIIPAGVAHKNLGKITDVECVGAYPEGSDYDINYGYVGERPRADHNIADVPMPDKDPVFGTRGGLIKFW